MEPDVIFYQWIAGLIDARGTFFINKRICTLTIKMGINDAPCLEYVKSVIGSGTISLIYGQYQYSLSDYSSLLVLLNGINGYIINSIKLRSFTAMLRFIGIKPIVLALPDKTSSYYAGFYDANGFVGYYLNKSGYPRIKLGVLDKF